MLIGLPVIAGYPSTSKTRVKREQGLMRFSLGYTVTVAIDGIGELTNEFRQ